MAGKLNLENRISDMRRLLARALGKWTATGRTWTKEQLSGEQGVPNVSGTRRVADYMRSHGLLHDTPGGDMSDKRTPSPEQTRDMYVGEEGYDLRRRMNALKVVQDSGDWIPRGDGRYMSKHVPGLTYNAIADAQVARSTAFAPGRLPSAVSMLPVETRFMTMPATLDIKGHGGVVYAHRAGLKPRFPDYGTRRRAQDSDPRSADKYVKLADSSRMYPSSQDPTWQHRGMWNSDAFIHEMGHVGTPTQLPEKLFARVFEDNPPDPLHILKPAPGNYGLGTVGRPAPVYSVPHYKDSNNPLAMYSHNPREYINALRRFKDDYYLNTGIRITDKDAYRKALQWAHDPKNASKLPGESLRFLRTVGAHENYINGGGSYSDMEHRIMVPAPSEEQSESILKTLEELAPIAHNKPAQPPTYRDFADNYRQKQYV